MSSEPTNEPKLETFEALGLPETMLQAIKDIGYERPSPIQSQAIPYLLDGRDLLGVAQTGTGKTAAFALPLLSRLDLSSRDVQILCLAPTRELAIQVEEAFRSYAKNLKGFHSAAIYGGQSYPVQIKALKKGPQVIVGTPGRVMDHMRKGTIKLNNLQALILDEADEMLRMGFIDDVEWVLEQTPNTQQIALFSATMPSAIKRITKKYLKDPAEVTIKLKTTTAESIRQRYWQLSNPEKLDTLARIIDSETYDAMIIFVRTKNSTVEIAEKLQALGHAADALNGDMAQNVREKCITNLKKGRLDILIATDVAARGLDVERISHVINYDVPYDTESYVHRIGRTGRAGRKGEAILFVNNREQRMLQAIERATRQKIEKFVFPSNEELNDRKKQRFFAQIDTALGEDSEEYQTLMGEYLDKNSIEAEDLASVLAFMLHDSKPFRIKDLPKPKKRERTRKDSRRENTPDRDRGERPRRQRSASDEGLTTCRIEVGENQGAKKGNIVGAIANECDLDSSNIGKIVIRDDYSLVDLPGDIPKPMMQKLQKIRIAGLPMKLSVMSGKADKDSKPDAPKARKRKPKPAPKKKSS